LTNKAVRQEWVLSERIPKLYLISQVAVITLGLLWHFISSNPPSETLKTVKREFCCFCSLHMVDIQWLPVNTACWTG